MHDKANVGFIDSHSERHGGHDNVCLLIQKSILVALPLCVVETSVIGDGSIPFCPQLC